MSNKDALKDKIKKTAASKLIGENEGDKVTVEEKAVTNEDVVIDETAATNEDEKIDNIEDAIANAYPDENEKREKILKGIYLDSDVLEVYKTVSSKKPRGWGSQLTSDLLRAEFEKQGLMPKRK